MLSNIRVLDFTRLFPGPFATQMLADLGAEVIKIEEPGIGDYARFNNDQCVDGLSTMFHSINRGKKSIILNIKKKNDVSKLYKLFETSDVIIESFRPGVLSKYLFGDKNISLSKLLEISNKKYKHLIICSISGYGQNGISKSQINRAGHDINYISKAGLLSLMSKPSLPPIQIADICGGTWPTISQILGSLYFREINGGIGNYIDVSMTDVSYSFGVFPQSIYNFQNQNWRKDNKKPNPISHGNFILSGECPCYEVYSCKDGYISVGSLEPKFWKLFCTNVLKRPDLINKQFSNGINGEKIKKEITNILQTKTMNEWNRILINVDCCVECVPLSENIILNDKHLESRNLNVKLKISGIGKNKGKQDIFQVPKSPFNMLHGMNIQQNPAPQLGEHTNQILGNLKSKL